MVEAHHRLSDLSALFLRPKRRWNRRPAGNHRAARLCTVARPGNDLALALLCEPPGGFRLRHQRPFQHRTRVRVPRGLPPLDRRDPRARDEGGVRHGLEPHLGPAPVVSRVPKLTRQPVSRLLPLARRTQTLWRELRRTIGARCSGARAGSTTRRNGSMVLGQLSAVSAGLELPKSRR